MNPSSPNLVPQNVTLSSYSVQAGNQVTINWTMANTGSANCAASVTGLRLGQSPASHPTSDHSFNSSFPTPAINASLSVQQSTIVTIPANTAAGTYYVWVIADNVVTSTLGQTSTADDYAHSPAVTVVSVPSLQGEPASLGVLWSNAFSGNYESRSAGQVIDTIVIHTSEGRETNPNLTYQQSYEAAISWFAQDHGALPPTSAHYCISPSGEITQMVLLTDKAYHATYYNSRSIGIEMGGFANDPGTWNSQNLAALERLIAYLVAKYNIQIVHPPGDASTYPSCLFTETGLIAHSQIQPGCNDYALKSDPGTNFPWTTFVQNVQTRVNIPRFTGPSGAGLQSSGQFQFEISTPSPQPVTVQASDDVVSWIDVGTVNVLDGKSVFTDTNAGAHTKRFYRPKP